MLQSVRVVLITFQVGFNLQQAADDFILLHMLVFEAEPNTAGVSVFALVNIGNHAAEFLDIDVKYSQVQYDSLIDLEGPLAFEPQSRMTEVETLHRGVESQDASEPGSCDGEA